MRKLILDLGENILKEGKHVRFRNERKKFIELMDTIAARFPRAVLTDRTFDEPYKSLAFIITVGQRPVTSLIVLGIFLEAGKTPLNGKTVGEKLAKTLKIPSMLTTKGGNYKDRVGDLISAFTRIGILEAVVSEESGHLEEVGFRIRESEMSKVSSFLERVKPKTGLLLKTEPTTLEELFKARFDQRIRYVVKSGNEERRRFSVGKILRSLLNPKLGLSFESALQVVEEIEPKLKSGIRTRDIQSMLYNALEEIDKKAAENYRRSYPEILSISMSDGQEKVVNYKLVTALINEEARLRLPRNLLDKFASTVYNVITRNPKTYHHETAVREYIDALIHSECMHIGSEASFVEKHLTRASTTLEGCATSLESEEVVSARGLLEQFLEHVSIATLTQFGYLPFKTLPENVGLISNLLKQQDVKDELKRELQLDENVLSQFQRIKFMIQVKETANSKSLEKMVAEGRMLISLCRSVSQPLARRIMPEPAIVSSSDIELSRILTGYSDLDQLLLGGIPENYAIILTSPSCDERDLLIERFLEAGAKQGQITFHITIDASDVRELAQQFPSNFYLFICNPEADAMIESLPNVFKLKGVENLTEISIALTSAFSKLDTQPRQSRRACIEIVSDALLQHHAVSTRRWLTALIPNLKSRGFSILAVINPHMHSSQEAQAILDLFQGEIHIYRRKTKKGLRRFLRIEKMINREYSDMELHLKKERMRREG